MCRDRLSTLYWLIIFLLVIGLFCYDSANSTIFILAPFCSKDPTHKYSHSDVQFPLTIPIVHVLKHFWLLIAHFVSKSACRENH